MSSNDGIEAAINKIITISVSYYIIIIILFKWGLMLGLKVLNTK